VKQYKLISVDPQLGGSIQKVCSRGVVKQNLFQDIRRDSREVDIKAYLCNKLILFDKY